MDSCLTCIKIISILVFYNTGVNKMSKVITGVDVVETIDIQTGEISITEKHTKIRMSVEEDYIKLYLRSISVVAGLPQGLTNTLNELLKRVDYNNEIILNSTIKRRICHSLGLQIGTLDHHLTKLVASKMLIRTGRGMFELNTYIFGRGKWADIIKHRETLGFGIEFSEDGHGKTEVSFIADTKKEAIPDLTEDKQQSIEFDPSE